MLLPRIGPRAQAALEVLALLAIGLTVIALVFTAAQERLTTSESVLRTQQAQSAANAIARAVDEVFSQGSGARRSIDIFLPEGTAGSSLANRTVLFKLRHAGGLTDVLARTGVDIYGALPGLPGRYTIWVTAEDQRVQVRVGLQDLAFNPTLLFHSAPTNTTSSQSTQLTTVATNLGTATLAVSTQLSWSHTAVLVTYANPADASFTLAPSASRTINLNVVINPNVTGTFSGSLTANASNGDTALVSIVVEVVSGLCPAQSCPPGTRTVARLTGNTYRDSTYTKVKLIFDPSQANQLVDITGGNWPASSSVTLDLRDPGNTSVSGYPKLKITNSSGGFNDTFDPTGNATGLYTLFANNTNTTATWSFTLTGCS